jgi:uncharacterized protein (DUF885 family)
MIPRCIATCLPSQKTSSHRKCPHESNKTEDETTTRLLLFGLMALSCTADSRLAARQRASQSAHESQQVREMLEDYFEEFLQLAPLFATAVGDHRYDDQLAIVISGEQRARRRALYQRYQGKIAAIANMRQGVEPGIVQPKVVIGKTLNSELFRAARLVVDVGLHRKNGRETKRCSL